ncbi:MULTISPECIES: hypothetical protein [Photorhabdus]|uniref:hypothetical protein n=1 Tax=Photorhabdus TaxID=29487 RepID=UPI001864CECA|nr:MULTISPECIES: hypothetical protein [Photorhabdus]MCT8345138.1 hypothetical protein [Photorhabdus kleinii]
MSRLTTYTDNFTGKKYHVKHLTVTQFKGNVETGDVIFKNYDELNSWLRMMGFKK